VILGHLIPAGTGFHTVQEAEVRIQPAALEALAAEKERVLERSFPLLDSALQAGGSRQPASNGERGGAGDSFAGSEVPSSLDALLGSEDSPSTPEPEAMPSSENVADSWSEDDESDDL
jgi:DNA-directed RNA polymerase subunit beta'